MKTCLFIIFLTFYTSLLGKESGKIIRLATLDWYPYVGQNLKDKGYVLEIVSEAFRRSGYKVEIKFYPWARAISLAKKGLIDGYFPEYLNQDLMDDFAYSAPYPGGIVGFFKRKDMMVSFKTQKDMRDFSGLKEYSIGVVRGYTNTKYFDQANYLNKKLANSDLINLRKLYAKRVSLIFIDKNVARYLIKTDLVFQFADAHERLEFIEPALEYKDLHLCLTKKTKDYQSKITDFNKGLEILKKDGTLKRLLQKHSFDSGGWNE